MKTISIIVPVYNVADYLDKCVNSIYSQLSDDVEVILVLSDNKVVVPNKHKELAKNIVFSPLLAVNDEHTGVKITEAIDT